MIFCDNETNYFASRHIAGAMAVDKRVNGDVWRPTWAVAGGSERRDPWEQQRTQLGDAVTARCELRVVVSRNRREKASFS